MMKNRHVYLILAALTLGGCWGCPSSTVIYPQKKELIETVYASGKIVPDDEFSLAALCNGRIVRKLVHDGDTVRKGQLLFEIGGDDARERAEAAAANYAISETGLSVHSPRLHDLALALQNADLKLQNDSITYFRWKQLWVENIGTKSNLDNCRLNYELSLNNDRIARQQYLAALDELQVARNNARTQLSTVEKELKEYSIRSDRDGIVYQTFKETGEAVRFNEAVALMGSNRQSVIRLAIDQQDIGRIRPGQEVLVQADATGGVIFRATISRVYPVMNEIDQTFRADARFSTPDIPSFIHSSVEANIIIQRKTGALVLPRTALSPKDSVLVEDRGKVRMRKVVTGISTPDDVEILSGIDTNTAVRLPQKTEAP